MDPVEVLAVEIHQFVGNGLKTLVPRVIGQTAAAQRRKGTVDLLARQWNEASLFAELDRKGMIAEAEVARALLEWANFNMPELWWGHGKVTGNFIPGLTFGGLWHQIIGVGTHGWLEIQFKYMKGDPPFDQDRLRLELLHKLNAIPGANLSQDSITKLPNLPLALFKDPAKLKQLTEVLDWAVAEIKRG